MSRGRLLVVSLISITAFAALLGAYGCSRSPSSGEVVVYTSVDSVEARKVLDAFTSETGIIVKPLFDTETTKTTGLAMRLLSEKSRPAADVFWNNELSRTVMLAQEGIFAPYKSPSAEDIPDQWKDAQGIWASFSLRARVIVYNTDLVSPEDAPKSLDDLLDERWKGKVGIANPLFGTTACHAAAMAEAGGADEALGFFRALKANGAKVLEGNSVVRDAAASGEIHVGLTDTDDVLLGQQRGMKIGMVLPDQGPAGKGTLVIPNSVALVAGGPNPKEARDLIDYLLSREVEREFADPAAGQIPVRRTELAAAVDQPLANVKALDVDWQAVSDIAAGFSRQAADILMD